MEKNDKPGRKSKKGDRAKKSSHKKRKSGQKDVGPPDYKAPGDQKPSKIPRMSGSKGKRKDKDKKSGRTPKAADGLVRSKKRDRSKTPKNRKEKPVETAIPPDGQYTALLPQTQSDSKNVPLIKHETKDAAKAEPDFKESPPGPSVPDSPQEMDKNAKSKRKDGKVAKAKSKGRSKKGSKKKKSSKKGKIGAPTVLDQKEMPAEKVMSPDGQYTALLASTQSDSRDGPLVKPEGKEIANVGLQNKEPTPGPGEPTNLRQIDRSTKSRRKDGRARDAKSKGGSKKGSTKGKSSKKRKSRDLAVSGQKDPGAKTKDKSSEDRSSLRKLFSRKKGSKQRSSKDVPANLSDRLERLAQQKKAKPATQTPARATKKPTSSSSSPEKEKVKPLAMNKSGTDEVPQKEIGKNGGMDKFGPLATDKPDRDAPGEAKFLAVEPTPTETQTKQSPTVLDREFKSATDIPKTGVEEQQKAALPPKRYEHVEKAAQMPDQSYSDTMIAAPNRAVETPDAKYQEKEPIIAKARTEKVMDSEESIEKIHEQMIVPGRPSQINKHERGQEREDADREQQKPQELIASQPGSRQRNLAEIDHQMMSPNRDQLRNQQLLEDTETGLKEQHELLQQMQQQQQIEQQKLEQELEQQKQQQQQQRDQEHEQQKQYQMLDQQQREQELDHQKWDHPFDQQKRDQKLDQQKREKELDQQKREKELDQQKREQELDQQKREQELDQQKLDHERAQQKQQNETKKPATFGQPAKTAKRAKAKPEKTASQPPSNMAHYIDFQQPAGPGQIGAVSYMNTNPATQNQDKIVTFSAKRIVIPPEISFQPPLVKQNILKPKAENKLEDKDESATKLLGKEEPSADKKLKLLLEFCRKLKVPIPKEILGESPKEQKIKSDPKSKSISVEDVRDFSAYESFIDQLAEIPDMLDDKRMLESAALLQDAIEGKSNLSYFQLGLYLDELLRDTWVSPEIAEQSLADLVQRKLITTHEKKEILSSFISRSQAPANEGQLEFAVFSDIVNKYIRRGKGEGHFVLKDEKTGNDTGSPLWL